MNMFEAMRRDAGMSAAELAEAVGMTERQIRQEEAKQSYEVGVYYALKTSEVTGHDPRATVQILETKLRSLQAAGLL